MFLRILAASTGAALLPSLFTFIGFYLSKKYKGYKGKLFRTNLLLNTFFQIPIQIPYYLYGYFLGTEQNTAWFVYILITGIISGIVTTKIVFRKKEDNI